MRSLLITFSLLILNISNAFAQQDLSMSVMRKYFFPQQIEQYTVSILTENIGTCTGVVVGKNLETTHVLSAKHCISEVDEGMFVENIPVKFHIVSPDDDLVLIVVDGVIPDKYPVVLAKNDTKVKQFVYHVGYPNWELYKSSGILFKITKDWYFAKLEVRGGCSGGGIFNAKGELTGILWGGFVQRTGKKKTDITIYEPISDVKNFLRTIKND